MSGLRVNGLTAGYGRRHILRDLSLPLLPSGSLVALVGANGVGKSTLLRALAGLQPATGHIELDGQDISRHSAAQRAGRVAYLPQTLPQGSSLLAYETVLAANRAVPSGVAPEALQQAIAELFAVLDLEPLAMRRLDELSGGQRQMVGLAQVLVRRPQLLLLDEPTSALDLRWQLKVLETVRQITREQGSVALLAIHDINLALRFCDQLVLLGEGGLLAAGCPQQVLDSELLRRAYGIEGRVERCSQGFSLVLADRALPIPQRENPA
ncbi:ABC transporter ATP-binding protein [Pseudomonas sp. ABC1]|uniref:ABC transporter ATP-binding protein n=1 Tax=Pseudomonas sp. ABC1 TaxID=2748080 RepID=UPI0015C2C4DD|nr:ABC transporter ATP-binding protein [Pseudomonas sp. ABC1]QLF93204.1 ABC transporter ATP-binding protein [Pseudomonas sp. ABC1]